MATGPTDMLEVLRLVTARLDGAGVPYMVSGSLALGYYAIPRMTRDIDIVIDVEPGAAPHLSAAFAPDFYCDGDAVARAVESRRVVNVIHMASAFKVDLIVRKDTAYRRTEFDRRLRKAVDGFEIWLVSPEDLLLSKLVWAAQGGSELQRRDAEALVASVPQLDWEYLEQWGRELDVTRALEEIRG